MRVRGPPRRRETLKKRHATARLRDRRGPRRTELLRKAKASYDALRVLPPALERGWVEVEKSGEGDGYEWRVGRGLRIGDARVKGIERTVSQARELAAEMLNAIGAM